MAQKVYETKADYLEAKRKRAVKYNAENYMRIMLKFHLAYDPDIIDFLETIPNRQKYFKDLIRTDMKSRGFETKEASE